MLVIHTPPFDMAHEELMQSAASASVPGVNSSRVGVGVEAPGVSAASGMTTRGDAVGASAPCGYAATG